MCPQATLPKVTREIDGGYVIKPGEEGALLVGVCYSLTTSLLPGGTTEHTPNGSDFGDGAFMSGVYGSAWVGLTVRDGSVMLGG